jgi:hypothetical protein
LVRGGVLTVQGLGGHLAHAAFSTLVERISSRVSSRSSLQRQGRTFVSICHAGHVALESRGPESAATIRDFVARITILEE